MPSFPNIPFDEARFQHESKLERAFKEGVENKIKEQYPDDEKKCEVRRTLHYLVVGTLLRAYRDIPANVPMGLPGFHETQLFYEEHVLSPLKDMCLEPDVEAYVLYELSEYLFSNGFSDLCMRHGAFDM